MKKRLKKENTNFRFNILTVFVYFVGIVLISKLFELQIIKGEEYRETSNTRLSRESRLEASRGDILDRSGTELAGISSAFDIELYKTKIDNEGLNKCIENLIELFDQNKVSYPDNFPINSHGTAYTLEGEELTKWFTKNKLQETTTPEQAIEYFAKKYEVNSDDIQLSRKIISIRYEITTKGYSSTKSLKLAENVSRDVVAQISERNFDFPGVTITTQTTRRYDNNNLAAHILGYIGKISEKEYNEKSEIYKNDDYVGRTGIESLFEDYLRGKDGKEEIEMSVDGTITGQTVTEQAQQGSTIVLTIDSKLQEVAENALRNNINKIRAGGFSSTYEAKGGCVAVIDVHSGEILAMASNPDYNPNSWVGGISKTEYNQIKEQNSLFNKTISGAYAPGSIFKMVTALAGLETGAISTKEQINDVGRYTKYRDYQPVCWYYTSYHRGHGHLNVSGAIEKSCNYFFYEVGDRMGIESLDKYATYFGLGRRTGIELPSETAGTLASPESAKRAGDTWSSGQMLSASIGQSFNSFSPLQIAKYIAMVANGGNKINPTIIKRILNADGTESSKAEINEYVKNKLGLENDNTENISFSNENIAAVLEGMRSVTEDGGTASSIFRNFDIPVGRKNRIG